MRPRRFARQAAWLKVPRRRRPLHRRQRHRAPPRPQPLRSAGARSARHRRRDRNPRAEPPPAPDPRATAERKTRAGGGGAAAWRAGEPARAQCRRSFPRRPRARPGQHSRQGRAGAGRRPAAERRRTRAHGRQSRRRPEDGRRRRIADAGDGTRRLPHDADRNGARACGADRQARRRCDRTGGSGATYLRLANARLRSGALIEPPQDNARFYLEAARQIMPDDPGVVETSRALRKEMLTRAGAAASAGNAAETERWLANADGAGARARNSPPSVACCRTS